MTKNFEINFLKIKNLLYDQGFGVISKYRFVKYYIYCFDLWDGSLDFKTQYESPWGLWNVGLYVNVNYYELDRTHKKWWGFEMHADGKRPAY